jgi:hypothetical protein
VAHTCNPSYSGGRGQKYCSSKPPWANSLRNLISKTPFTERTGGVTPGVGPEFKPQYSKKKNNKKDKKFLIPVYKTVRKLKEQNISRIIYPHLRNSELIYIFKSQVICNIKIKKYTSSQ